MKYEAVIFDLFGTLVPNLHYGEYQGVLKQMASVLTVSFDAFQQLWSETARERSLGVFQTSEDNIQYICKNLKVDTDDTKLELVTKIKNNYVSNVMRPEQDTIDTLSYLRSKGMKIGLISNCSPETPLIWRETPLARLVDVALFSSSVGIRKPDPRIYRLATEQLAVKPESCMYVGDGDSQELSGAAGVSMYPVLIRLAGEDGTQPHLVNREDWNGPVISSLTEIITLIE
jgi:putative hydrolase of the HAD superfamily